MSLTFHPQHMSKLMTHPILLSIVILFTLYLFTKWLFKTSGNKIHPPSPPKLPILGNLHQVGLLTHRSLHSLGRKYGPVMLLHFGSKPVILIQSAEAAMMVMRKHDLALCDKPTSRTPRRLMYDTKGITTAPYSEYWRKLKGLCVIQVLSSKKVNSFSFIRQEETEHLMENIKASGSSPLNLSKMFLSLTNDIICRSVFGRKYSEGEEGKKFLQLLDELLHLVGKISIGEFIPSLAWINRVNGFDAKVDRVAKGVDRCLDEIVQDHLNSSDDGIKDGENRESFLAILLEICKENINGIASIDKDNVKAIILDLVLGGTDTTAATITWAMTELLLNPRMMNKLQDEIRGILRDKRSITDNDLEKMHYLKAVVRETLRHHPPIPLMGRKAREDVKVMGYEVPAGTMMIINAWAIGRDPLSWNEHEKFQPERFLNSSVDFMGQDFEYVPFGAGRRRCPGIAFGTASIEHVLANLMHRFAWDFPDGKKRDDQDAVEGPGVAVHRKYPLFAVATPYHF